MGTSFEEILNRMRNAHHAGVPAVTNPKVPTKVERDVAEFKARRREMPNFHFGTGTKLEQLVEHMKNAPHPTPNYGDPAFNKANNNTNKKASTLSKEEVDSFTADLQAFIEQRKIEKANRKKAAETGQDAQ